MKSQNTWLAEYAISHQNPVNQWIHKICVPAIFVSIVGLLSLLRWPGLESPFASLAVPVGLATLFFYFLLGWQAFFLMLAAGDGSLVFFGWRIEALRTCISRCMPEATGELVRAAHCTYTMTPDEHFVIDRHPLAAGVVFAAGFSGHGFKFASVVGEVLADLAIEGSTRHPIDFHSVGRPALRNRGAV